MKKNEHSWGVVDTIDFAYKTFLEKENKQHPEHISGMVIPYIIGDIYGIKRIYFYPTKKDEKRCFISIDVAPNFFGAARPLVKIYKYNGELVKIFIPGECYFSSEEDFQNYMIMS